MGSEHDLKFMKPLPFVQVITEEGKCRRFAAGTKAGFALERINNGLKDTETGTWKFTHIESVKEGEEAVDFGPGAELVSYGEGWQLRAVQERTGSRSLHGANPRMALKAAQSNGPKVSSKSVQIPSSKADVSPLPLLSVAKPDDMIAVSSLDLVIPISNMDGILTDPSSGAMVPSSNQSEMMPSSISNDDEPENEAITPSNGGAGKVVIELPLPVSGIYNSLDELLDDLRQFTRKNGYNVIKDKKKSPYVYQLRCDKSKMPRKAESKVPEHKRRKSSSKRTGCPFRMRAVFKEQKWTFVSSNAIHNHGPREIK